MKHMYLERSRLPWGVQILAAALLIASGTPGSAEPAAETDASLPRDVWVGESLEARVEAVRVGSGNSPRLSLAIRITNQSGEAALLALQGDGSGGFRAGLTDGIGNLLPCRRVEGISVIEHRNYRDETSRFTTLPPRSPMVVLFEFDATTSVVDPVSFSSLLYRMGDKNAHQISIGFANLVPTRAPAADVRP